MKTTSHEPRVGLNILTYVLIALALAAGGAAAARDAARMRLPAEFAAAAERLPADGFGGANRGRFAAGPLQGDFVRIESRFAVFDPLYAVNRGKSSFTLEGPGIDDPIAGECGFKERVVTLGIVTFDATKLAYVCEIVEGAGVALGTLALGEPKPTTLKARLMARAERRGLAEVGGVRIDIVSVHELERSKLTSQTPIGYLLSMDDDVVGALELTATNPTLLVRRGLSPETYRAATVAALGLSVLRDPANSALGD
jgi:hypothetical protein